MCLGRDLAVRNLLHWGQWTLVTVCWAEPGLPVSGRHMYELWDLRVIEQVEEEWEVKVEEALEVVEVEEVGCRTSDTQGSMAALAEAEAWSSLDWMLITG